MQHFVEISAVLNFLTHISFPLVERHKQDSVQHCCVGRKKLRDNYLFFENDQSGKKKSVFLFVIWVN